MLHKIYIRLFSNVFVDKLAIDNRENFKTKISLHFSKIFFGIYERLNKTVLLFLETHLYIYFFIKKIVYED